MERPSSPKSNAASGFLRPATDCRHDQTQQSPAPRTVCIAVTKPSLFGKRPPPRTPSMTVKNRTSNRSKNPEIAASRFCQPGEAKLQSGNTTQAHLHPVFVALNQDVEEYPCSISLPDATEALSAVCISRLGRSPCAGGGSLPGTPFGTGSSCVSHLEFLHRPCAVSLEAESSIRQQRPGTTSSLQVVPHVTATADLPVLHNTAPAPTLAAPTPVASPDPLQPGPGKTPQDSPRRPQTTHLLEPNGVESMQHSGAGQVHIVAAPALHCGGSIVVCGVAGGFVEQRALEPETAGNTITTDTQNGSDAEKPDFRLCIMPTSSSRCASVTKFATAPVCEEVCASQTRALAQEQCTCFAPALHLVLLDSVSTNSPNATS